MDNFTTLSSEFGRYLVWYYAPRYDKSGKADRYNISQFVEEITISDSFAQPAKEVSLTLSTAAAGNQLRSIIQMGGIIRVMADTFDGTHPLPMKSDTPALKNELFRGYVFTRDNTSTSLQDSMAITAYDPMIYLSLNESDLAFKKLRADQIIRRLASQSGLKVGSPFQETGPRISRVVTRELTLYDGCVLALQKNQKLTGKRFRLHSKYGKVCLWQRADPDDTWTFDSRFNIQSGSHSTSIMDLTTRLTVKSHKNKAIRLKNYVSNQAEQKYGVVHKYADIGDYSASETRRVVQTVLRDHSKPDESIQLTVPVINSLEPGLGVYVYDDDLRFSQLFWVEAVSHQIGPASGSTQLTLRRREADIKYPDVTDPFKASAAKTKYKMDKAHTYPNVTVAVVDFQLAEPSYKGTESICTIRADHPLAKFPAVEIYSGKTGKRVSIIHTHSRASSQAVIRLAKVAAQSLRPVVTNGSQVKAVAVKEV